jgi:diguanylate cyclase (GGDEF)-like protein
MLRRFNSFLAGQSAPTVGGLAFALMLFLAGMDHLTGEELSFSVFYLMPISIAAWYGNRRMGYIVSGLSAATWLLLEQTGGRPYSHDWILFWNTAVRLGFFFIVAYLLAELGAQLQRQQQLARTDSLTGVLNRAGFFEHATAAAKAASRYGYSIAVAYIDLDGFKNVNDTLGHLQGDAALKLVGNLLGASSRESDVVARIGGDEFVVLLPNTTLPGARAYFDKLQVELQQELQRQGWAGLGLSIGAVLFEQAPEDVHEALRLADIVMYRAKRSGKSAVIVERAAAAPATLRNDPVDV